MDKIDQKILHELQVHGYQKPGVLARRIGIGAEALRRRINKMRSNRIINIVAMPNPIALGYKTWAHIGIKVESGNIERVTAELLKCPAVYTIAYYMGQYDIWAGILVNSLEKLGFFVNSKLTEIEGIVTTEKLVFTNIRKYYHFLWPAPVIKENGPQQCNKTTDYDSYEIDETDRKILDILTEYGLTPTSVLKDRLGIGERTIRKRINAAYSKRLFSLEVVPNIDIFTENRMVLLGIMVKRHSTQEVADLMVKNPSVFFVAEAFGKYNLVVMARFENIDAANHFVNAEVPKVQGIASIEPYIYTKVIKLRGISVKDLTSP